MLNNVLQAFIIYQTELCHDIWTEFAVPDTEALTACLIFIILSVKKEANSLQALVDRNSEATDTGVFVRRRLHEEKTACICIVSRAYSPIIYTRPIETDPTNNNGSHGG